MASDGDDVVCGCRIGKLLAGWLAGSGRVASRGFRGWRRLSFGEGVVLGK